MVVRALRPHVAGLTLVLTHPQAERVEMARLHRDGLYEARLQSLSSLEGGIDYHFEVRPESGRALPSRRPLSLRPQRLGLRPAPLRRGHAARRPRSPGRAPDVDRRHQRRALRGVGAQRAARIGRRRLQRLGRPRAPDAAARAVRHLGSLHSGSRRRRALQVRDPDDGRSPAAQGGPVRALLRDSAAIGGDRLPHRGLQLGRRRVDGGTRRAAPARETPDGDLRGAPRLVADRARRRKPSAHVSRAGRHAGAIREGARASRTSSCCRCWSTRTAGPGAIR